VYNVKIYRNKAVSRKAFRFEIGKFYTECDQGT